MEPNRDKQKKHMCRSGADLPSGNGSHGCNSTGLGVGSRGRGADCGARTSVHDARTCLSGQKCRDGHCTVECTGPAECKEGQICRIGVCVKGGRNLSQCYDNRDCVWPETCYYGQCVTRTDAFRCNSDLDCGVGYRCVNGRCI